VTPAATPYARARRMLIAVAGFALLGVGCGPVGLGLPSCETPPNNPTSAVVLAAQAVPEADYGPCVNSLKLGWDEVGFQVESGMVRLTIGREFDSFLDVRLTASCDVAGATAMSSGLPDIERYESVSEEVGSEIRVTLIPTGERPRIHALALARELSGMTVEDRPVTFTVDEDIDFSARQRVNKALFADQYVWIISDLDIEEDTLEMRMTPAGEGARGLSVDEALDRIEDLTPETSYRGQWYFVFHGGCITYDFDASGVVAQTIAKDVEDALGFYPNVELKRAARRAGYEL
jgi:hypothetical protein